LLGTLAVGAACAHVEPPPGGPEDRIPPVVLTTRPADEAVVPRHDGPVVFVFDERISEQGVEDAVMVSPRTSPVEVRHGRDEIRVSLRQGWLPNTIYHVNVRPDIRDMFGNRIEAPLRLVFSTGPEIPGTEATGRVTDRITGQPERNIRVEAIRAADSLVYAVPTDSVGGFDLRQIPEGEYQFRAFRDLNRNRALDPFEPRDTAFASVREGEPVNLALRVLMPDTMPPEAGSATLRNGEILVEFDDYLDPEQEVSPTQVDVVGPDGVAVAIVETAVVAQGGPTGAALPPPAVGAGVLPGAQQPPAGVGVPEQQPPAGGVPMVESLPSRSLRIELAEGVELQAEAEYRVVVRGIVNVNGLAGDSETTLQTPAAPPPPPTPAPGVTPPQ
jgi:hypothetical protein